jgi:hexulose-6-phosphate isomerase
MLGNHLFGLYEKALDAGDSWPVRLAKARQLGFDFVEICIDEQEHRIERLYQSDREIGAFARTILDAGVPIKSMCLSAHRRYPFGSADRQKREKACDIMERAISFACATGIRVIQLAGYDVYYEPTTEQSRDRFLEGLGWAVREAARQEVMLAVEIMDTDFINSITRYLWYADRIRSPWLKVYPDLGNLTAWGNDVQDELKKGIGEIVAVHVKDTQAVTPEFGGQFKSVPFGAGCVDFVQCFSALEELRYAGPYLLEMWHQSGDADVRAVASAKAFIDRQYARSIQERSQRT